MAGLLDIFGTGGTSTMGLLGISPEDIARNRDDAQAQALYALAGRLFQGGNTGASIAQGLQQGQQAYKGAMQGNLQEQLQNVQLMDMLRKRKEEELAKSQQLQAQQVLAKAYRPETFAETPLTNMFGQEVAGPNQPQEAGGGLKSVQRELMGLGPAGMTALQTASGVEKALRPEGYTLGEGQIRYEIGPDGKPVSVATGAPKEKSVPAELQGYNLAVSQGYGGSFLDYQTALKKAGIQNTIVNVAGKTFASEFSKGAGEAVNNAFAAAQGAVGTLGRIETLKPILEGGKLFSGTLGSSQVAGARLADALNIGGKDNTERLQNTALAMQQLAGLELNAAEAMKGQGAITENERGLIARAAAGDLMKMTAKEVSTLLGGLEKTANYKISMHESNLKRLKQNPDLAAVAQYYELPTTTATPSVQNIGIPSGVTVKRK